MLRLSKKICQDLIEKLVKFYVQEYQKKIFKILTRKFWFFFKLKFLRYNLDNKRVLINILS